MTKKFVLCADGVYVKNVKILLVKRSVEPFKGCWHLIGGHVEANETLKEALKREFKEETNLTVRVGDIIDGRIEETFDRIKMIVALEIIDSHGKIKLSPENEEYGWFDEIPNNSVYNCAKYLSRRKATEETKQNFIRLKGKNLRVDGT